MPDPIKEQLEKLRDAINPLQTIASLLAIASELGDEARERMFNMEVMYSASRELTRTANDLRGILSELEETAESQSKKEAGHA